MRNPPKMLPGTRTQAVIIGLAAAGLAIGGFQMGRRSVDAATWSKHTAEMRAELPSLSPRLETVAESDLGHRNIREIATVPFSELYDVLRAATREQLMAWAADLERMPRGPRQEAAVAAYYKSLIQVNPSAAIEAVLHAQNLSMRYVAIDALMRAAPESIWGDLAEMAARLPDRGGVPENLIWNWSRVDPVAASQFIETHSVRGRDDRLFSLLCNWGEMDPAAARDWVQADASRQTKDAFRALVSGWADNDHAAAIDYAVANASRPNMDAAINDLAYKFFRESPDDAKALILLLPTDKAKAAMKAVAYETTAVILGASEDYQRPPDIAARWMVNLPLELWKENIGEVVEEWLKNDADAATLWLNQMRPDLRDAAVANLCRAASSKSTERAIALGLTISDPNLRDKAMGELARGLGKTREEAITAVNQLPIPAEHKSYLLKIMPEAVNGR
jgi:hypothetical protein